MKPSILVVTATLGNRNSLQRTIDSTKNIKNCLIKHIIVAPQNIIPKLKEKYPNIDYIAEPQNKRGIYAALNHAFFTYGKGFQYFTFINDDDYWLPQFQILIDQIRQNPELDFVYGKTIYINDENRCIGKQTSANMFKRFIPLLHSSIILLTQQSTLIKSQLFFKIGGFDENYKLVADTKFWATLSLLDIKYKYVNKYCAAYTIQEGQLSSDISTQRNEHSRLLNELPQYPQWIIKQSQFIFRIINFPIYFNRIIKRLC